MPCYSAQCCKYDVALLVVACASYRRAAYTVEPTGVAKIAARFVENELEKEL